MQNVNLRYKISKPRVDLARGHFFIASVFSFVATDGAAIAPILMIRKHEPFGIIPSLLSSRKFRTKAIYIFEWDRSVEWFSE